jgi:hypothetical protein
VGGGGWGVGGGGWGVFDIVTSLGHLEGVPLCVVEGTTLLSLVIGCCVSLLFVYKFCLISAMLF